MSNSLTNKSQICGDRVISWIPFQNKPRSAGLDLYETNVKGSKYKTEVATDHYIEQYNADKFPPINFIQ